MFGTALVIAAYIPQIVHLTKMRCGEGLSLSAYALWTASSAFLCVYAIIGEEPVFMALQGYHAGACGLILFFGVKYRTSRCPLHRAEPADANGQPRKPWPGIGRSSLK